MRWFPRWNWNFWPLFGSHVLMPSVIPPADFCWLLFFFIWQNGMLYEYTFHIGRDPDQTLVWAWKNVFNQSSVIVLIYLLMILVIQSESSVLVDGCTAFGFWWCGGGFVFIFICFFVLFCVVFSKLHWLWLIATFILHIKKYTHQQVPLFCLPRSRYLLG